MLDAARNSGELKPYLGNRAVQWGKIDANAGGTVPMTDADIRRYRLRRGDLLVCEGGEVGRAAIWRDELPECYFQKALHRLRPIKDYDVRLMLALLEYWSTIDGFANYVTQTSIAHLPREKFVQMPLPVFGREEQKHLGDLIDDLNGTIATLERLVAKKQAIKQGMMQELLTGRTRIGGYRSTWRTVSLTEVADRKLKNSFVGGPFGSSLTSSEYTTSGVQILQLQNIGDGHFRSDYAIYTSARKADELGTNNIFPGDVLIAKMGDPVARACIVPAYAERYVMASDGIRLSVDRNRFSPLLVKELINQPSFRAAAEAVSTGSTRRRIALGALRKLQLVLPNELAEQQAIATALSDVGAAIDTLRSRLEKARLIKQGMMQELLTGRTRLPIKGATT